MRRAPPAGGPPGSRAACCRLVPDPATCAPAHPRNPAVSCAAAASDAAASAAAAHAAAAAASAGRDARREAAVLGGEDFILSQRSGVSEDLFKGEVLGTDADVASVAFRQTLLKDLGSLPEGLHPPPRFLERVAVHFARSLLAARGDLPGPVPLILGIWGPKGGGKTFSLELCLRDMGVLPVCLSAGELEDEWAGEPGRRLRERYEFAARHAASTGQPTCLVISDFDAGVGTFANTSNTVNTQNLQGSLMALCDAQAASLGGAGAEAAPPVPIFITANDLSLLYAPLVREGRMDKFFFEPTRAEMAAALCPLFSPGLAPADVDALLAAFPHQPLDFFGALRSRLADGSVRGWLAAAAEARGGPEGIAAALQEAAAGPLPLGDDAPSLAAALEAGRQLAAEQQAVLDVRLSLQYMKGLEAESQPAMRQRRAQWRQAAAERAARAHAAAEAAEAARRAVAEASLAAAAALRAEAGAAAEHAAESSQRAEQAGAAPDALGGGSEPDESDGSKASAAAPATPSGLPCLSPDELAAALRDRSVVALDVRSARDWGWGRVSGAAHAPVVLAAGSALAPEVRRNPDFLAAAAAALGPPSAARRAVLIGPGAPLDAGTKQRHVSKEVFVSVAPNGAAEVDGQDIVAAAASELAAAGYLDLAELAGGYRAWDLAYRPDGRRRARGAFRDKSSGELEWWTASN